MLRIPRATPLHVAADKGKFELALTLIDDFGCDLLMHRATMGEQCFTVHTERERAV